MLEIEDYKSYVGISSPNKNQELSVVVPYVNDFIERYCGISLSEKVRTFRDIAGSHQMYHEIPLPDSPVVEILEVKSKNKMFEDYELEDDILMLFEEVSISTPLVIKYRYGFDTMPAGLKMAAIELCTHLLKREFKTAKTIGSTGESISMADPELLPPHIRASLDMYRV